MIEQIDPQIAADLDKGSRGDPAAKPPQQIVAGDKREQHSDRRPQFPAAATVRKSVDEIFDSVLRANGTADRGQHRSDDDNMARQSPAHIM
jgi:hypothetical protein